MTEPQSVKTRSLSESKDGSCMVCCEVIDVFSIGMCDHPICFKCSARMRVLSKQNYCPSCRSELEQVVFCHDVKNFGEFHLRKLLTNRKFGIHFEDSTIRKHFDSLLEYVCVICKEEPFDSMNALKGHVRKSHSKQFCVICIKQLSVFPFELKLYSQSDLVRHRKQGDKDEKSHRGHPECRFCEERYFDNDALLLHLRKSHFWCHFCEHDGKQDYYDVYDSLRKHFADEHFLCDEGECRNEKFTSVYRDKIDFQAHKLAQHSKRLNKFQAKEARKVDIDFSYGLRQQYPQSSVVTGADYDDVRRDDNRREKSSRRANNNSNSSRYHRENNGTLNYYDYEDVERDRKRFSGRQRRHEAEEVDSAQLDRAMAASLTLSNSEPNLPRSVDNSTADYDVIGYTENISDINQNNNNSNNNNNGARSRKKETNSPVSSNDSQSPREEVAVSQVATDMVDFPSLPGARSYVATTSKTTTVEDFPALTPSVKPKAQRRPRNSKSQLTKSLTTHPTTTTAAAAASSGVNTGSMKQTDVLGHVNGIQVTKAKTRKKGKTKQTKQSDNSNDGNEAAFPTLGTSNSSSPVDKQNLTTNNLNNSKLDLKPDNCSQKPPTSKKNPSARPAPGLQAVNANEKVSKPPPGLTSKQDYPEMSRAPPPGLDNEKVSGGNSVQRNLRLMAMLQAHLDDFNLDVFKDVSGQFRREVIPARQYYETISALLGDKLKHVFSELVDLLPEEKKRQELLVLHNDYKIKAKQEREKLVTVPDYTEPRRWGATSDNRNTTPTPKEESESRCDQCGITMKTSDVIEHMESHRESFPALPLTTKKKKHVFAPSSRHSKNIPVKSAWGK